MAKKKTTKKKAPTKKTVKKKAPAKKKKAPAKRKAKSSGAEQLDYVISGAATKAMTKSTGLFYEPPANSNTHARGVPRFDGNPSMFAKSVLHYKIKDAEGNNIALGCLDHHGDEDTGDFCYVCALCDWLLEQDDEKLRAMGKGFGSLGAVEILYFQAWVYTVGTKEWKGPMLIKAKGKMSTKLGDLISSAEDFGTTPFVAPVGGQVVVLHKTGEGKKTRYDASMAGNFIDMDDVDEDWKKKVIRDIPAKLDVKVWTANEQKKALHMSYPDWPWSKIQKAIG